MAIDTRAKRQAAAGAGVPLAPSILPTGTIDSFERGVAAWTFPEPFTITLFPIVKQQNLGELTLLTASATAAFSVFIDGVDKSVFVRVGAPTGPGIQVTKQVNSRDTATMTFYDEAGTYAPDRDQAVLIYDSTGRLMFNGYVDRSSSWNENGTSTLWTQISCIDAGILCDRRVVNRYFTLGQAGLLGIMVSDIVANELLGTGITFEWNLGPAYELVGEQSFYAKTVTEVFNEAARISNSQWRVDEHRVLRFFTLSDGYGTAPGNFTDSSLNWEKITQTRTGVRFANRIYAKSSRNLSSVQTDTFEGTLAIYITRFALSTGKPAVYVNTVAQVVVTQAEVPTGVYWDFWYIPNGIGVYARLPLTSSDTVVVKYLSPFPYVAIAEDAVSIAADGLREAIIEAGDIPTRDELQDVADGWLARGVEKPDELEIVTTSDGYSPGQRVGVNVSIPPINDTFIIDSVSGAEQDQHFMRYTIRCTNSNLQRPFNANRYMGDIIAATRTPPNRVVEHIAFQLAVTNEPNTNPGLTSGVKMPVVTAAKPGIIGYLTLTFGSIAQGTQTTVDIEIDMFKNGTSIFDAANRPILRAGEPSLFFWQFLSDPLTVATGDQFTIEIISADPLATDGDLDLVVLG